MFTDKKPSKEKERQSSKLHNYIVVTETSHVFTNEDSVQEFDIFGIQNPQYRMISKI